MSDVKITNDGTPYGTRVYLNGEDITDAVTAVSWDHEAHAHPSAQVRLRVAEGTMLSGQVRWVGLERVPSEALEAELRSRLPEGEVAWCNRCGTYYVEPEFHDPEEGRA